MTERALASLGGYEVLAELDSGGMGEVLIARKRAVGGFERLVALKTVRSDLAEVGAAREMFLDEGRLLARLHHRGIAQVYDFGEDGDRLYLAMEYVAGIDFEELADREAPPRIACLAMAEACRALHAAHELADHDGSLLGVVHRDVSPGNLMLTYDGGVKVLDFGIALMRNRRAPVTEFGMLKGKPPYMAPEQVRSEAVDPRTDVFSACAVLWELLTGERLFTGDSIFAIGRAIEQGEVPPPSSRRPGLPENLDALVLQGLSKNPDERFQSASSLANGLESIARTLGTESLADYARRELSEEKRAHEAYVAELAKRAETRQRKVGRATAVNTIPAIDHLPDLGVADTAPGPGKADPLPETEIPERKRKFWPLLLVFLGLAAGLGLLVWQLVVGPTDDEELAIDAAVLAIDATSGPAKIDAKVLVPMAIDAGPVDARKKKPIDARPPKPPKRPDARPPKPKKPDAAPAIEPPKGQGTITILTKRGTPFARVRLDGRGIGVTPIFRRKVSAGPHTVVWINADNDKVRKRQTFTIADGEHKTLTAN